MIRNFCLGALFCFFNVTNLFAQDQASAAGSSRLSFSTISSNPFQSQFTFRPEAAGKIVIFNAEGDRVEERYFSKDEEIELGQDWPKGDYQIKIFGLNRTDFTKIRED